jgi:hypothetical protein
MSECLDPATHFSENVQKSCRIIAKDMNQYTFHKNLVGKQLAFTSSTQPRKAQEKLKISLLFSRDCVCLQ